MLKRKTHFEQVPLEIVNKTVEGEYRIQIEAELASQAKKKTLGENPLEPSMAKG